MRESGVLMHITSLPGKYGIGTMGKEAYKFVDFLKEAGQSYWQILPLTPTGYGDSPYQSCSAFAGNYYLIDLELLMEDGLLSEADVDEIVWNVSDEKVDFGLLYTYRLSVLRKAYARFSGSTAYDRFCVGNSDWLSEFSLFMALKDANEGLPWYAWEDGIKYRDPDALWHARQRLKKEIGFYSFVQFLFFKQWNDLHNYAHGRGIRFIGDVPIYVPMDSVDVWANQEQFQLTEDLQPAAVAGCPPDAFSDDGQLWGNPLYRWDVMRRDGYAWWIRRLNAAGRLYDVVRMDHFRGLEAYWSVPYGEETARNGRWVKGPGMDFIQEVKCQLPQLRMIAEDLGYLTQEVLDLRDASGFPGMKVLEFAFDTLDDSAYLPHNYPINSVCYTGTHDNMTLRQWFESAPEDVTAYAAQYMSFTKEEGPVWGTIRTAMRSVSELCIIQIQDYLELGGEARMNFPGTMTDCNWTWRVGYDIINRNLAQRIYRLTKLYGRLGCQRNAV